MLGTACHDGRVDHRYAHSLMHTVRLCDSLGIELHDVFLACDALVQRARNDLVRIAVEHDFDDMIMIDADQDWDPEWIPRLLSYPVDCVGGTVRRKTDAKETYNVKLPAHGIERDPETGLIHVDGLGCGFIRFSRCALKALWEASEEYRDDLGMSRWVFDVRPIDGHLVGEDVMVARKLQGLGIPTFLDPDMTCGHTGPKRWAGDFAAALARIQPKETHDQDDDGAPMMVGGWFLASLNRTDQLCRLLDQLVAVGTSTPGQVILGPDQGPDIPRVMAHLPPGWEVQIQDPQDACATDCYNRVFRECQDLDWYGSLSDDHWPVTPGWDVKTVEAAMVRGIASTNDGWQAPHRMHGAVVFRGEILRLAGWWLPPCIQHNYGDDFWEEIGRTFGIWTTLMDVMVEHRHPMKAKGALDSTYQRQIERQQVELGQYQRWKASEGYTELLKRFTAAVGADSPAVRAAAAKAAPAVEAPATVPATVTPIPVQRMRRVLIGTPAHDARLDVAYVDSLLSTINVCRERGIDVKPLWLCHDSLIQRARNDLVKLALDHGYDDLFFIDSDQQWTALQALALIEHDVDVVGAPVIKKADVKTVAEQQYNVRSASGNLATDRRTGLMMPDAIGTGFLRLSRRALEALWHASLEYRDPHRGLTRMVFDVQVVDGILASEDFVMCAKLRAAGFPIYLDQSFTVAHIGPKTYRGDFATWVAVKAAEHAAQKAA